MKIIPAILAFDLIEFETKLAAVAFAPEVQIDIMDGVLVENTTVQLQDIASLPDTIQFEVHLMVADPLRYLPECARLGIQRVALHAEIEWDLAGIVRKYKEAGIRVLIALSPETSVEVLHGLIQEIDGVLLMSVHPGFGGQTFMAEVLAKVSLIQAMAPDMYIEMDGGIHAEVLGQLGAAQIAAAVVGNRIAGAPDARAVYQTLTALASGE